ncbi:MAG: DUF3990 domain-containing protein [Treponema sp.]|jgi:hypothetical protein|nr:DUF3990 domain-containing protein [Treponema sp.]
MEAHLTLYHGSNHQFDEIDLSKSKDFRDFGRGFYTTTLREQAEDWAAALFDRFKGDGIFIYETELELSGGIQHNYDIVQGPVANDKTARTIALYIAGIINAQEAIERLRSNRINDQVSLHTPAALSRLTITRRQSLRGKYQK